jgi:hypothetical protein
MTSAGVHRRVAGLELEQRAPERAAGSVSQNVTAQSSQPHPSRISQLAKPLKVPTPTLTVLVSASAPTSPMLPVTKDVAPGPSRPLRTLRDDLDVLLTLATARNAVVSWDGRLDGTAGSPGSPPRRTVANRQGSRVSAP